MQPCIPPVLARLWLARLAQQLEAVELSPPVVLFVLPACTPALYAQTLEVLTKVEARLWFQRWLDRAGSLERLASLGVFAAIAALLVLAVAWRRRARRKRERGV